MRRTFFFGPTSFLLRYTCIIYAEIISTQEVGGAFLEGISHGNIEGHGLIRIYSVLVTDT